MENDRLRAELTRLRSDLEKAKEALTRISTLSSGFGAVHIARIALSELENSKPAS
jgi:hypothetical protein